MIIKMLARSNFLLTLMQKKIHATIYNILINWNWIKITRVRCCQVKKMSFTLSWSGLYGMVAIEAVKICQSNRSSPIQAWEEAVRKITTNLNYIKKGCPKNTFLGLCEDGLVFGVPAGSYTHSIKNKQYAIAAVSILKSGVTCEDSNELWIKVLKSLNISAKTPNGQMDVVLALWNEKYVI